MNPVLIVLPILALLMFELGLTLKVGDFYLIAKRPKAVAAGLTGQIVVLPLLAFGLAVAFNLDALFFIGVLLIACCPGGSSSNIFSMLAGGDVALSVSLTALSSIITLFTIPLVMQMGAEYVESTSMAVHLPVGSLIIQNIILMLVPIALGVVCRKLFPHFSVKADRVLSRIAFPCLILLATIFFLQHYRTIMEHFSTLGACVSCLILGAMVCALILCRVLRLNNKEQRTIIIEVGMQNAAQAIAIASSPFIFHNDIIAIPAIIYALLMNIILLIYVGVVRRNVRNR